MDAGAVMSAFIGLLIAALWEGSIYFRGKYKHVRVVCDSSNRWRVWIKNDLGRWMKMDPPYEHRADALREAATLNRTIKREGIETFMMKRS